MIHSPILANFSRPASRGHEKEIIKLLNGSSPGAALPDTLLPDHVIVHPGSVEDSTPSNKQQIAVDVQQDVNLRRGADLLLARKDVDPKRLAYGCNTKMGQAGAAVPTFLTRDLTR